MSFLSFLAILLLGGLVALFVRTSQVERMPEQEEFLKGRVPEAFPVGRVNGVAVGFKHPPLGWRGKIFRTGGTGVNLVDRHGKETECFPFKLVKAQSLRDRRPVIRIEYHIPANPWWARRGMDEIVETEPGIYLGKAYARILPGIPFALGFFRLHP